LNQNIATITTFEGEDPNRRDLVKDLADFIFLTFSYRNNFLQKRESHIPGSVRDSSVDRFPLPVRGSSSPGSNCQGGTSRQKREGKTERGSLASSFLVIFKEKLIRQWMVDPKFSGQIFYRSGQFLSL